MAYRGENVVNYASWREMDRIDQLIAQDPPKISIIEGATPKATAVIRNLDLAEWIKEERQYRM